MPRARQPDVPTLAAESLGPVCALLEEAIIRLELLPPTAHVGAVAAAYRDRLAALAGKAQSYAVSGDGIGASRRTRMQKADFVKAVAEKAGVGQKEAKLIVDTALEVITDAMTRGEKVTLTGFGTFEVRARQAREGVNPQTREKIQIAATTTPGFSASSTLKDAVKGA